MTNSIDKLAATFKRTPLFSIFAAAAAPTSLLLTQISNDAANLPVVIALGSSPLVSTILAGTAGLNLFRERSKLSKAFSAATVGAAGLGMAGYLTNIGAPGFEALASFFYSAMGMTAAGLLSTAAHYTRNVNLNVSASLSKTQNDTTPPAPPAP